MILFFVSFFITISWIVQLCVLISHYFTILLLFYADSHVSCFDVFEPSFLCNFEWKLIRDFWLEALIWIMGIVEIGLLIAKRKGWSVDEDILPSMEKMVLN